MGTSTGYEPPTTGNWPDVKREVTNLGKSGSSSPDSIKKVTNAYIRAQGGSGSAAQKSSTANKAGAKLAGLFYNIREDGLGEALEKAGLEHLVGLSPVEVISGIRNYLSGPGKDLDDEIVAEAFNRFIEDKLNRYDSYEALNESLSELAQRDGVYEAMKQFFGHYVFLKFKRDFSERLLKVAGGVRRANRILRNIKDFIFDLLRLQKQDVSEVDWRGEAGAKLAQEVHADVWRVFGGG